MVKTEVKQGAYYHCEKANGEYRGKTRGLLPLREGK